MQAVAWRVNSILKTCSVYKVSYGDIFIHRNRKSLQHSTSTLPNNQAINNRMMGKSQSASNIIQNNHQNNGFVNTSLTRAGLVGVNGHDNGTRGSSVSPPTTHIMTAVDRRAIINASKLPRASINNSPQGQFTNSIYQQNSLDALQPTAARLTEHNAMIAQELTKVWTPTVLLSYWSTRTAVIIIFIDIVRTFVLYGLQRSLI